MAKDDKENGSHAHEKIRTNKYLKDE